MAKRAQALSIVLALMVLVVASASAGCGGKKRAAPEPTLLPRSSATAQPTAAPAQSVTAPADPLSAPSPPAASSTRTVAPAAVATSVAMQAPEPSEAVYTFEQPLDGTWQAFALAGASVGVGDRPGYLRITAGDGMDLFPGNNYDAPRAWRLAESGDWPFTVKTRVEFTPTAGFQGAGLLIWKDQDHFLRLERCYGGYSGGESGICFLVIDGGKPHGVSGAKGSPTTEAVVDLRIERAGDTFRASWRPAGEEEWRPSGEYKMALTGDLRLGVLVAAVSGKGGIAADFDSFELTR